MKLENFVCNNNLVCVCACARTCACVVLWEGNGN